MISEYIQGPLHGATYIRLNETFCASEMYHADHHIFSFAEPSFKSYQAKLLRSLQSLINITRRAHISAGPKQSPLITIKQTL